MVQKGVMDMLAHRKLYKIQQNKDLWCAIVWAFQS